jgi:hypothetical protein
VVATVLLFGVMLALVAVKFRRPPARRAPRPPAAAGQVQGQVQPSASTTLPVTRPALVPRDD